MFVDLMRRLRLQSTGKVYFIVDGHPTHRSKVAKMFVTANTKDVRLIQLPGYCPELNPDELLNQDVKTNALGKSRPRTRHEMMTAVRRHLFRRQKQPQVIKTCSTKSTCATRRDRTAHYYPASSVSGSIRYACTARLSHDARTLYAVLEYSRNTIRTNAPSLCHVARSSRFCFFRSVHAPARRTRPPGPR